MARRAQSEYTICKLRRDGLDRQRESIYRRHGRRSAGNAGGGQRRGMKQNISGASFTACAVFSLFCTIVKLHNGGAFRGVLACAD